MNRRRFAIGAVLASVSMLHARNVVAQATLPSGTVQQIPNLPEGIAPMPVSDEFDLLYFRVLPGFGGFTLLGEMQSKVDYWTTASPLILDFGRGVHLQPQIMRTDVPPHGRCQFLGSGGLLEPDQVRMVQDAEMSSVTTSICEQGLFPVDLTYSELALVESNHDVNLDEQTISATATIRNDGDIPAPDVEAFALVYDEAGYYCGEVSSIEKARIVAGDTAFFEIQSGEGRDSGPNPLDFVNREAQVVVIAGFNIGVSISCV